MKPYSIKIKEKVANEFCNVNIDSLSYLNSSDKPKIRKVLLFFNLYTMINSMTKTRFSFEQYKNMKWDIEHIHARATDNEIKSLTRGKPREEYLESLKNQFLMIKDTQTISEIDNYIANRLNDNPEDFLSFCINITNKYGMFDENSIGNLTLLDAETNRSYHNSLFPVKRSVIVEKDKGESFIPVCTKNVFLKMYSKNINNPQCWNIDDVRDYITEIKHKLIEEAKVCK